MTNYPTKSDSARLLEMAKKASAAPWTERPDQPYLVAPNGHVVCGIEHTLSADFNFITTARTSLPEYVKAYEQVMGLLSRRHFGCETCADIAHGRRLERCEIAEAIRQWEGGV